MNLNIAVDITVDKFEDLPAKLAALAAIGEVRAFNYYASDPSAPTPLYGAAGTAEQAPAPKVGRRKKDEAPAPAPAEASAPAPAPAPAEAPAPAPAASALSNDVLVALRAEAARVIGADAKNRPKVHALVQAACGGADQPSISKVPPEAADKLLADIAALSPKEAS